MDKTYNNLRDNMAFYYWTDNRNLHGKPGARSNANANTVKDVWKTMMIYFDIAEMRNESNHANNNIPKSVMEKKVDAFITQYKTLEEMQ